MGCTYSRLGATLGSPKLRLLSLLSLLSLLPTLSVAYQANYRLVLLLLRVAVCHAPSQLLGSLVLSLYRPPLCSLES